MYWFFSATAATVLGLLIGSFLNVVIHRGPAMWRLVDDETRRGDLIKPRSYCPSCGAQLNAMHLVPIVGYLMLGGKCASCGSKISQRYPVVELLGALAGLGAFLLLGATTQAFFAALFFWALIALAFIDLETGYLPDALTLPLLGLGLAVNAFGLFASWQAALIGAVAGYLTFRIISEAFLRLRGQEGLGQGDAKLLAAVGAWLGWQALPPVVFIASIAGLTAVLIMRLSGKSVSRETALPYGPYLSIGAALAFLISASGGLTLAF